MNFDFFIGPSWMQNPARRVHLQNVYEAGKLNGCIPEAAENP